MEEESFQEPELVQLQLDSQISAIKQKYPHGEPEIRLEIRQFLEKSEAENIVINFDETFIREVAPYGLC